jgi:acyl carrier protein
MPEEKTVEEKLKDMIVERLFLNVSASEIGDDDDLMTKFDVDSVRLLEMIVGIEEVFGLSFEDEEFDAERFKCVRSIAEAVRAKQGK